MAVDYYEWTHTDPPIVLRRTQSPGRLVDELFRDGSWVPTKAIIDYMFGHNLDIEEISAARARKLGAAV